MYLLKQLHFLEQMETTIFLTYCIFDSLQKSVVMLNMLQFILGVGSSVDHATRLTHGGSKMFLTSVLQLEEEKKKAYLNTSQLALHLVHVNLSIHSNLSSFFFFMLAQVKY